MVAPGWRQASGGASPLQVMGGQDEGLTPCTAKGAGAPLGIGGVGLQEGGGFPCYLMGKGWELGRGLRCLALQANPDEVINHTPQGKPGGAGLPFQCGGGLRGQVKAHSNRRAACGPSSALALPDSWIPGHGHAITPGLDSASRARDVQEVFVAVQLSITTIM